MLGSSSSIVTNNTKIHSESFIMELITQERHMEAYSLLISIKNPTSNQLFNKALCLVYGSCYQEAIECLKSSLSMISFVSNDSIKTDHLKKVIEDKQNSSINYMSPISKEYTEIFPVLFKELVCRVLSDCYLALKQWDKILELPAYLSKYKNIKDAMSIAKNNIGV